MKRGQTYHKLCYHLVFATKNRSPTFSSQKDGDTLRGLFQLKAHQLESSVIEMGLWKEHVHQIIESPPKSPLSSVYGQMKGFSAHAWNLRHPERPLKWQDGVFIRSVDPDSMDALREYVRNQWRRHEERLLIPSLEPRTGA